MKDYRWTWRLLITLFFFFLAQIAFSQSMSSPYSIYGIGDIDHRSYNSNSGLGYTGLALKTTIFSSGNNPASISGLQKSFYAFDLAGMGRFASFSGTPINSGNNSSKEFVVKRFSFSTKVNSFWGTSVGFQQFSNVSYKFQGTKEVEGSLQTYQIDYSGDGGLNNYYWNNGFNIGKHFALGVTTSVIAGPINQTETITQGNTDSLQAARRDYFANVKLDYGFIYSIPLNKKWEAAIAGRFSNRTQMNSERALTVTDNSTVINAEKFIRYNNFSLPVSYGAGLSLVGKNGMTFVADYTCEDWSKLNIGGTNWKLTSSNRLSAGAEFANYTNSFNKISLKKAFQFGAFYDNSYLFLENHHINEYGFTAGITKSFRNGLMYGLSLEAGSRGTTQSGLIKENYFQATFSFSFKDVFHSRGRRYD